MATDARVNPKLALSIAEVAEALSVSVSTVRRFVLPRVKVSIVGGRRVVAVRELERYLEERAA